MKSKKGQRFLTENSLKLVISVLVIALVLIPLIVKVYAQFRDRNELEKAERQLDKLVESVNNVKQTNQASNIELFPPAKGWLLLTYFPDNTYPKECVKNEIVSCLCLCQSVECNEKRKCEGFNFKVQLDERYIYGGGSIFDNPFSSKDDPKLVSGALGLFDPVYDLKLFKEGEIVKIKVN